MARDVTEPGTTRDRFLSEFALALVEGVPLQEFLDWAVAQIGRILGADRFTLFLLRAGPGTAETALAVRSSWAAEGFEAVDPAWTLPGTDSVVTTRLASFETLAFEDILEEPDFAESAAAFLFPDTKSLLAVPIGIDGAFRGFVAAAAVRARRLWTSDDVAFLESAAHHLSAAFKQTELVDELGRERDRLSVLFDLASAVQRSTTTSDVVETALSGLRDTLLFPIGVFSLIAPSGDAVVALGGYGDTEPGNFSGRIAVSPEHPTVSFRVLESGRPLIVSDVEDEPEGPAKERYRRLGARSFGVFPMRSAGKTIGVMSVASRDASRRIELEDAETLQSLADFVGVALEQRRSADAVAEAMREARRSFAERAALALRLSDLVGALEKRTSALEVVTRATQLLNFRLHAPDVLTSIVEETTRAFPSADGCVAWVCDASGTNLSVAAADGVGEMTQKVAGASPHPPSRLKCAGLAFLENRPVFTRMSGFDELSEGWDPEARARARAAVVNADVRSLMAVPIRVGDHRLGVLEVLATGDDAFTAEDGETLALLAEQSAIALRNARLIEELQKSNRLKDDFLANLSHEIRTPLTGIVGWAEVLLDSHKGDAEAKRALEAILGQADTLSRMLADLIDLSRIDNFGLELRRGEVAIPEILAAALDAVSPGARRKGVTIRCELDPELPQVEGDGVRLKQVLWNLLSNGVKFSPPGGTVRVFGRRLADGRLELAVEDEGHGIAPEFLPLVFDRFRQEETSSNRRYGGLGIGLAIARAIVLAHGGTIVAESEGKERGSRFRVTFPRERVTSSRTARREPSEAAR